MKPAHVASNFLMAVEDSLRSAIGHCSNLFSCSVIVVGADYQKSKWQVGYSPQNLPSDFFGAEYEHNTVCRLLRWCKRGFPCHFLSDGWHAHGLMGHVAANCMDTCTQNRFNFSALKISFSIAPFLPISRAGELNPADISINNSKCKSRLAHVCHSS